MLKISRASKRASRTFSSFGRALAKNDASTIDSYKLPSQTSINEWDFKYDFVPKVAQPKIPPVSPEAIRQDIAKTKKQQVEQEMFHKEQTVSVKVEANDASVVHGGESVATEPEYLHDHGLDPVDASNPAAPPQKKKTANTDKYVQLSLNPEINNPSVVNLGYENKVDHKVADVESPAEVHDAEGAAEQPSCSSSPGKIFALLGLGGVAGYVLFNSSKQRTKTH